MTDNEPDWPAIAITHSRRPANSIDFLGIGYLTERPQDCPECKHPAHVDQRCRVMIDRNPQASDSCGCQPD